MRTWFIAVAMAACVGAAHAACFSPSDAGAAVQSRHAGTMIVTQTGADAARFIAAYNARPPVTSLKADTVVFARNPAMPTVLVMFFNRGCFAGIERLSPNIVQLLLQTAPKPPGVDT